MQLLFEERRRCGNAADLEVRQVVFQEFLKQRRASAAILLVDDRCEVRGVIGQRRSSDPAGIIQSSFDATRR